MGFVRTAAEVSELQSRFSDARFLYEGLRIEFLTTTEFIQSILPPGLELDDEPIGLVSVGRWQSHVCGEFDTASIFVKARYGEISGYYNLSMFVSGEMPVTWGREVWGEVKKHARISVFRDGSNFYAYAERNGVRAIEIRAHLHTETNSVKGTGVALEVKAFPSADGKSLEYDPLLLVLDSKADFTRVIEGTGTLTLRSTVHDPLASIPIVKIKAASFAEGEQAYTFREKHVLCGREEYLPYLYGRHYDDLLMYPSATRYKP